MFVLIPGISEYNRQNKVKEKDILDYKKNSSILILDEYDNLTKSSTREKYFEGAAYLKQGAKKRIAFIRDLKSNKIFKIELFHPQSLMMIRFGKGDKLKVVVNSDELKKKGTIEDPIIALRYTIDGDMNNNVSDEKYNYNVKEYLTYKDYKPINEASFLFILKMFWVIVTIIGFSTTTGILIKKGYINKQGNFEPNGPNVNLKK